MSATNVAVLALMGSYVAGFIPVSPLYLAAQLALSRSSGTFGFIIIGALIKSLPIALLALATSRHARRLRGLDASFARYVALGLFICSVGDILLDWQEADKRMFIPGLATFLVGHICYILAFTRHGLVHSAAVAVPLCVLEGALLYALLPGLPSDLLLPVPIYAAVVGTVVYTAATRVSLPAGTTAFLPAAAGAVLFCVSDGIIGASEFGPPALRLPHAKLWIMLTYYGAQLLIAASALTLRGGGVATAASPLRAAGGSGKDGAKRD